MATNNGLWFVMFLAISFCFIGHIEAKFSTDTSFTFGAQQSSFLNGGNDLQLLFDLLKYSFECIIVGGGVQSNNQFLFGSFQAMIKLIKGNSAGTVTTFYLSSTGDNHDEIDFEFLGNASGQPYTVHTNIFAQGIGAKEQQFRLWFDPTSGFHNYTIHWNPSQVVWYVDSTPIRVFRNYQNQRILYPNRQPMRVYASLWNADDWATQGGRVKTNWTLAPFVVKYSGFKPSACVWTGNVSITQCAQKTRANWWTSPAYSQLSNSQRNKLTSIGKTYKIYDYCKDFNRFQGKFPAECSLPQF
ncbi:probable xyloglucan endotransglucosylase/hydrolase protein 26 [Impatiens glandulifera]|uniref:probable xyloglucan endotransglucosylase/hydrolase protein 26 n=1 Tax=Impatiens glandulifera TaxID=253017 RepID=UPI001FB04DC1|nr:probable xyloglucan endotransglucosylase/hydrolase protein 26 [Impatiens glandulifera]